MDRPDNENAPDRTDLHLKAEEPLQCVEQKLITLSGKLQAERSRIEQATNVNAQKRHIAEQTLVNVRAQLDQMCDAAPKDAGDIISKLRSVLSHVPKNIDEAPDEDRIRAAAVIVQQGIDQAISNGTDRLKDELRQARELERDLSELDKQLRRIDDLGDMVPLLPGLDEVLLHLKREQIRYSLLFQHLEWRPETPLARQSAVEAALGPQRLGTIVVSPEQTIPARKIVMNAGQCLRILDALDVKDTPSIQNHGEPSLLDFLDIRDQRVQAHLQATVAGIVLKTEVPPDGVDAEWFAEDGAIGERGARWQLNLEEPRWIGEQRRREICEREHARLKTGAIALREQTAALEKSVQLLQSKTRVLCELRDALKRLSLPWSLTQPFQESRHSSEALAELTRMAEERTADTDAAGRQRDELAQLIAGLRLQVEGTDAAEIKRQIDLLENEKTELSLKLVDKRVELETTQKEIETLDEQMSQCESDAAEARHRLELARASLRAVLAREFAEDLDQYVFGTKRGSHLKEEHLEDNITNAREREIELKTKLVGSDGVLNDKLAIRYAFRLEDDDALLMVRDRANLELDSIVEERREQERQMKESLNEKTRDLFETILARDLAARLRSDLMQIKRTRMDINKKLAPLVFGHSRFQLAERLIAEYRPLVDLIERQTVTSSEHRDELRHYLEDRRDQLMEEGDVPAFLDYRNWFDYSFRFEQVGMPEGESLGSEDIIRGSVGAQTTHNYLLLLAQAALLFDRGQARLRLLMLDDAFYGLDVQRKELLLRCGKQLGLDFVIATPDLDGTIQEHSADSTTLLVENDGQGNVAIMPFEWERLPHQPELFPEPRPEAVLGVKEPSHESN